MSEEKPAWLDDTPVKDKLQTISSNSQSTPSRGEGAPATLSESDLKQSSGAHATPSSTGTQAYDSPSGGGDGNRMPTSPPEDGSNSAGHGRRSTPPQKTSVSDADVGLLQPSPTGVLSLGGSMGKPPAGSGMAPSLLNRRKNRTQGSDPSNVDSSAEEPLPKKSSSAPMSISASLFGRPISVTDTAESPSRAGGLPLSLSPGKGSGSAGGISNGSFGLGTLPSAEVKDMENQLAALRRHRRHSPSPEPSDVPPPEVPRLPLGRGNAGLQKLGERPVVKESPRGGRDVGRAKPGSGEESPRSTRFGRRSEIDNGPDSARGGGGGIATTKAEGTSSGPGSALVKKSNSSGTFGGGGGGATDLAPILELIKSGNNWQRQTDGLNKLRDVLRTIQSNNATSSSSAFNDDDSDDDSKKSRRSATLKMAEVVRQNLHDLVHAVLDMCENGRSSLSKLAMDTVGLLCRAVSLRITNNGNSSEGRASTAKTSGHTIDHFVEPLATKLILKGGSTSSKFLFDSALYSLRELLESVTNSTRAMSGLLNIQQIKTEKSKVLWAEALGHCLEVSTVAGAQCFNGKEFLSKCLTAIDALLHDAWADVRDGGRNVARLLAQTFKETNSTEELCFVVTRAVENEIRRELVLGALDIEPAMAKRIGGSSCPPKPVTPRGQASHAKRNCAAPEEEDTATAPSGSAQEDNKQPKTPPPNTKIPPPPGRGPSSGQTTGAGEKNTAKPPLSGRSKKTGGSAPKTATPPSPVDSDSKPEGDTTPVEGNETSSGKSTPRSGPTRVNWPAKKKEISQAHVPRNVPLPKSTTKPAPKATSARDKKSEEDDELDNWTKKPTPPTTASGGTGSDGPSLFKRQGSLQESFGTSPSLTPPQGTSISSPLRTAGESGVFGVTLANEARQHGAFSAYIEAAADGNWKDRADAMSKIELICNERELKGSSSVNSKPTSSASSAARSTSNKPSPPPAGAIAGGGTNKIESKTAMALCDVVALRCADTNVHVQTAALSCTPVLLKCVPVDCIDVTSSKWISCLTTALGSRNENIACQSKKYLGVVIGACSPAEVKGTLQCLSTTMVSVRNPFAKATLIQATMDCLWSPAAADPTAGTDVDDSRFLLEMGVKLLTDEREEINSTAKRFVVSLVKRELPPSTPKKETQSDPDTVNTVAKRRNKFLLPERAVLDHPSLPTKCWDDLKELIDAATKLR